MSKIKQVTGAGLGLRHCHLQTVLKNKPSVSWFEILADNFFSDIHGQNVLSELKNTYPMVLHSVGLSLGSPESLNETYLEKLRRLAELTNASWLSDHLCWTQHQGRILHELLPLRYDREALDLVAKKVDKIQNFTGRRFLLENVSKYIDVSGHEMAETEFLNSLCKKTGCGVLLDVSNLVVNQNNLLQNPAEYLEELNGANVIQLHIAGYSEKEDVLIDSHSSPVSEKSWETLGLVRDKLGDKPTLLEWDSELPDLEHLLGEYRKLEMAVAE